MHCFSKLGDSLVTLKRALEAKELTRQQLREQLDEVEKETRSKLQEIDIFNNQLKVTSIYAYVFVLPLLSQCPAEKFIMLVCQPL